MDKLIRNLPLQIFLIVPFVIIVLASGGLTGYLAFHNSQNAINELANQLYGELTSRIQQHLGNYLTTPYLINQLNLDAIRLGELNVQDAPSLERHFSSQLRQFDSAMSVAYADEQQNYVGIQLIGAAGLAQGNNQILSIAGENTNHVLQEISIDAQGRQLEQTWASPPGYDPRSRPWYRAAVQAGGSTWTPIFMWSSGVVGLDAVTPVYSDGTDQKRLLGVLDTSLTLTSIGNFLQQLNISEHGQTFIMERSGLLVASSSVKEPYARTGSDLNRLSAFDSTEPVVRATSQYLEAHFANLAVIESSQRLHFHLNADTQTVQVTPYHDQYGLDWLIVLVIPESDFMGQIAANSQSTGLLIAILLLASVIVAILITRWVTQPILRLNSAAKALTAGDWKQRVVVGRTDEVGALASSFNRMAEQLQGAFASLQRSEERYRSLFDGVPIGLYRTTPEGQILDANPALVQML